MGYVKIVGHTTPGSEYGGAVLRDEDGENPREVKVGEIVNITADQKKWLESRGFEVEESSKDDADKAEAEAPIVAADVVGTAPVLGTAATPQSTDSGKTDNAKKS